MVVDFADIEVFLFEVELILDFLSQEHVKFSKLTCHYQSLIIKLYN
jgi:hypothetical protein